MQETYKLIKWIVVTDKREYVISENELNAIMSAEANNSRFVALNKVVLNIAFIKEIYRKVEVRDGRFSSISERDKKYLKEETKKLE